jgi:Protein of unknown function (DUF3379)
MTDEEFFERLLANPADSSPAFVAAWKGNPEREKQRAEVLRMEQMIRLELDTVPLREELYQKLFDSRAAAHRPAGTPTAANDGSFLRRGLLIAASLVVAVGILWPYQTSRKTELVDQVFEHVYRESAYLERQEALPFAEVNTVLAKIVDAELLPTAEMLAQKLTFADDCEIDKVRGFHLVMKGQYGPVTVFVIPNSPVASGFNFGDRRFQGMVLPTDAGNVVVVGEQREPIQEYRNLISSNLRW